MNILYQSTSFIPSKAANSIHVTNMSSSLCELGHNVTLIGLESDEKTELSTHDFYGLKNNFDIITIKYQSVLEKLFYFIKSLVIAFKQKPDLVISRSHPGALFLVLFGFKVVLDAHRPVWEGNKLKKLLWNALKNSERLRVTTNSNSLKQMFIQNEQTPDSGITVAYNGATLKPHDEILFSDSDFKVGYIGGLYQGRGIDIIMEIAKHTPDIKFHVAGGSQTEIDEIKRTNPPENIIFHGFIEPSNVHRFRNSCDVLIAPYHEKGIYSHGKHKTDQSSYQNPIKVIEYLSSKKPIIASNTESIKEILSDQTAILVSPKKIDDWVEGINKLKNDKELRKELSEKAFEVFEQGLTWKARAAKLLSCHTTNL